MPNWGQILQEITREARRNNDNIQLGVNNVRKKYLNDLFSYTRRNTICYYSGWLSKPGIQGIDINDEDKNGFMTALHGLDHSKGLDLILHTPGGSIATAETLVDYLKRVFGKNMRAIVPQISMSAGTMIACSCKEIIMGKQSNLGPVDPQRNGIPAAGVVDEYKKAYAEITANPQTANVWQFVLRQYTPSFLGQCENAVQWAKSFVQTELENNMFSEDQDKSDKAAKIVYELTDFGGTKGHDRHIHIDECKKMGLKIIELENDQKLQDAVLSVHHCFMHTLMNTSVFKIIENHRGQAFAKNMAEGPILQFGPQVPLQNGLKL